jgi:phenylpropionate dioxygenase-like ring-hydroxylating dioxygenase large terminal subunit
MTKSLPDFSDRLFAVNREQWFLRHWLFLAPRAGLEPAT